MSPRPLPLLLLPLLLAPGLSAAQPKPAEKAVTYAEHVAPLLEAKCTYCHDAEDTSGALPTPWAIRASADLNADRGPSWRPTNLDAEPFLFQTLTISFNIRATRRSMHKVRTPIVGIPDLGQLAALSRVLDGNLAPL